MSKKYTLKINNANNYAMIVNSYQVFDGNNNLITSGTNLSVGAKASAILGTQTLADTDTCYWGGSKATFTSVGAPSVVSSSILREDYNLYTLNSSATTTTYGLNKFTINLTMNFTKINTSGARTFEISNTSDFATYKSFSITLSGTTYNYTATLTESDLVGVLSSGIGSTLYVKDVTGATINFYTSNIVTYFKLVKPTISASTASNITSYSITNPNAYACNLYLGTTESTLTLKGAIGANATITGQVGGNNLYADLRGYYFTTSDTSSYNGVAYVDYTVATYLSTTGESGSFTYQQTFTVSEVENATASSLSNVVIQQDQEYKSYNLSNSKSSVVGTTASLYYYTGTTPTTYTYSIYLNYSVGGVDGSYDNSGTNDPITWTTTNASPSLAQAWSYYIGTETQYNDLTFNEALSTKSNTQFMLKGYKGVAYVDYTVATYLSTTGESGSFTYQQTFTVSEVENATASSLSNGVIQQDQEYKSYNLSNSKSSVVGTTASLYYYTGTTPTTYTYSIYLNYSVGGVDGSYDNSGTNDPITWTTTNASPSLAQAWSYYIGTETQYNDLTFNEALSTKSHTQFMLKCYKV